MADNILDSITEQYHSLTKSGKKLQIMYFPIQQRLNTCQSHPLPKTAMYPKLLSPVSAEALAFPVIMRSNLH